MTAKHTERLRSLPAISRLLEHQTVREWVDRVGHAVVVAALKSAVDQTRQALRLGSPEVPVDEDGVLTLAAQYVDARARPSLRRVINATGVVLHTGLGRAPLCAAAVSALLDAAGRYSNLEMDLESGNRGRRVDHIAALLCELTGAESATVVNNNAAATLLTLNTVARGAETIVSRGQLVEIGGSYRLPEMMSASGTILREVGTTNRTRISDYERAISENTAALMRVHTSNYRVSGFVESVPIDELAALGKRAGKIVIDDLGSGALFELTEIGLPAEPHARASLEAGADLVCFSGDKLLGGPQAGIILGRRDLIRRVEANPLMRTYRVDKLTLAALEATLRNYRDRRHAVRTIPCLAMLACEPGVLMRRAQALRKRLKARLPAERFEVVTEVSVAGGGSLPGHVMETRCIAWRPTARSIDDVLADLRHAVPPVIARAKEDKVLFDVRTLFDDELAALVDAVDRAGTAR